FQVALEFREIEVRARAAAEELVRVVEEVEAEVDEAGRDRLAVEQQMALEQVPAAWTHDQRSGLVLELVAAAVGTGQVDRAAHRVDQIDLAVEEVEPGGR